MSAEALSLSGWIAEQDRLDDRYGIDGWHCDDLAHNRRVPQCVLDFLSVARAPAYRQGDAPPLYATYEGRRVRVTMASRFGDVGITTDLSRRYGYDRRVYLPDLSDFSSTE